MEKVKSAAEFREKLRLSNSHHAVLTVGSAALIMITADWLLKISLTKASLSQLFIFLTLVTGYLVMRYFYNGVAKWYYTIAYIYVHAVVIWGFAYVITIPSPMLAFLIILSLSAFLELGYLGMSISMLVFSAGILFDMHYQGELTSIHALLRAVTYLLAAAFIGYYATIFLRVGDEELLELDKSAAQMDFERSRLAVLVYNLNDAVLGLSDDLKIELTNPKAQHILNLDVDPTGKNLTDLMRLQDADGNVVNFKQLLSTDKKLVVYTNYRLYYSEKDFINLYIAINNVGLNSETGETGYVVLLRDITRQKSLEDERTEFISIMSHELRTPVSIVEGGISLAQSLANEENEKLRRFLDKAHDQTIMLAEIVNSLSTLAHNDREQEKLEIVEVDPRLVVQKIANNYTEEATRKGLELKTDITNDLPMIYTNQEYLVEILQNFITNALKYTKQGSITIKVTEANHQHIAFSVTDTGIGISVADQEHVFQRFWRSEDYRTRESNGTGLGLYLTKKLADSLGAVVQVESELDKGSTFTLNIPIANVRDS